MIKSQLNPSVDLQRSSSHTFGDNKQTPVILVCIHNVNNTPITHDILHSVFCAYGPIYRILIFEKTKKWKAFIEYSNSQSALAARENLDDFLLYSDGTRINIYPSNLHMIKFQNNNSGGHDYTLQETSDPFSPVNIEVGSKHAKRPSEEGSNGLGSPQKKHSDLPEETCNRSTSAETGSHSVSHHNSAHSAHSSGDEKDEDDDILQMIREQTVHKAHEQEEEPEKDEDNDKDGFIDNAFFSFKGNDKPSERQIWKGNSFESVQPEQTVQKNRLTNVGEFVPFQPRYQGPLDNFAGSQQMNGFNSFNNYLSSTSFLPPNSSFSPFGSYQIPYHGMTFNSQENFYATQTTTEIADQILSILQSSEFQESPEFENFALIDQEALGNMSKEELFQLHADLIALEKEAENKKSAVLHVNGLEHKDIKVQMIYNIFSNFGNITKIILMKNKASALIEFENTQFSALAKDYLNNIVFMGKPLRINYSNYSSISIRNKQNKSANEEVFVGNQRNFRFSQNKNISINPPSSVLHVSNLTKDVCKDQKAIKDHFIGVARVEGMKFLFGDNGKNMCLLRLPTIEDALRALAHLHDTDLGGRKIQISFTRSKI
jgi:hypothetical protein